MRTPRFRYVTMRSKKASVFKRLFSEWHEILAWFEKKDPADLPYWHLERSNVGHLALAAYQINGRPLQEFSMTKGRGADKGLGRADLYICIPKGELGPRALYLSIEAKQRWCFMRAKPDKLKNAVKESLQGATSDCKELTDKEWQGCKRLGISFILPYIKTKEQNIKTKERNIYGVSEKNLLRFTDALIEAARASKADFAAIHYAPLHLSARQRFLEKYDWCPGIAVIGRFL
jgi:hypothetical protein